ncbi:MAG: glycosyltransferase family 2 protein [Candidatus Hydrothermarchaeota archaeon]
MKKASIIVLNWNGRELTRNCLRSIKEETDHPDYEVIVVDNGSTDGSQEMLKREFPWARLIENPTNLGFARGNNQGMEVAEGDYTFLLNNDTIVTKGWLAKAVEVLESDPRIASVGSTLVSPDWDGRPLGGGEVEKDTVCGAAMLLRRKVIERIGPLDDRNFSPIYGEETDWNYRARNIGYRVVETGRSVIKHIGSVDTTKGTTKPYQYVLMNTHRLKAMLYNDGPSSFLRRTPGLGLIFLRSIQEGTTLLLLRSYWNNVKGWRNILEERGRRQALARRLREERGRVGERWY